MVIEADQFALIRLILETKFGDNPYLIRKSNKIVHLCKKSRSKFSSSLFKIPQQS